MLLCIIAFIMMYVIYRGLKNLSSAVVISARIEADAIEDAIEYDRNVRSRDTIPENESDYMRLKRLMREASDHGDIEACRTVALEYKKRFGY